VRATNKRVQQILNNPNVDQAINKVSEDLPKITARLRDTSSRLDELIHDRTCRRRWRT